MLRGHFAPRKQNAEVEMSAPQRPWFKPVLPDGGHEAMDEVDDEVFLDLQDRTGTQHLAATCYGAAVQECLMIDEDAYVLKVRSDMRGLLVSQLRTHYQIYRLFRLPGGPEGKVFPTGRISVRFAPGALPEQRRACLGKYCDVPGEDVPDGIYGLAGKFAADPISGLRALELEPAILRASPFIVRLPEAINAPKVDLTVAT